MPDCKHCKGIGYVYPTISQQCSFCYNHPEGKKTCCECMGKGWEKKQVSSMCMTCGGTGKK